MRKKRIQYLVMDVDGTLTDGKIYMSNEGELCKAFSIKDGCGIHDIAIPEGIIPIIITGRKSQMVMNRCKEIGIKEVHQGISNKIDKLRDIVSDLSIVGYIGDDLNDLDCMNQIKEMGGVIACPKDAAKSILAISDYIAEHNGGEGAVRDFIEWLIYD